ncbi:hypothetical protein KUTeg_010494 [Tegillarca granosa]|uniref:G-protein coupled receptors family 1 profile domain-containing protein n=1 Tax=Tegillarca granosa TaxID=220873 RepID=A0ABQ9FA72_TEGGR|nr:hypothetical protein KUTeg_010494 [Tegillarca granosa]
MAESILQNTSAYDLSLEYPIRYAVPLYGVLSPIVIIITLVTNTFILVVLLKKHMRTPTNVILASMAVSDMLTGIFPFPLLIYYFGLGYYSDYVPNRWCRAIYYLLEIMPTVCHTSSVWITMFLTIHRYIQNYHSMHAKIWCTVSNTIRVILVIYFVAILSHVTKCFDTNIQQTELSSKIYPNTSIVGCQSTLNDWFKKNKQFYKTVYYLFRVICIHLIPCTLLLIFNLTLISTLRSAKHRRIQLLNANRMSLSRDHKTLMLFTVVAVFLMVEIPLGIDMTIFIIDYSFGLAIFDIETSKIVSLISNQFILLTYPTYENANKCHISKYSSFGHAYWIFSASGHYKEYIPYEWCHAVYYLFSSVPKTFHTASIWLTTVLAIQRYVQNYHYTRAKIWLTISNVIRMVVIIYSVAILSQAIHFFNTNIQPIELPLKLYENKTVTGCHLTFKSWFIKHIDVNFNVYYWFRAF